MRKAIILQAAIVLAATVLAALVFGMRTAASLLLGGLAYLVPNLLFVAYLTGSGRVQGKRIQAGSFFAGEFFKVVATLAILLGAQLAMPDLQWPALLIGLFVALKANLLALLLKS